MQTDAAAFEGWALALKRWCDVETVTLTWVEPQFPSESAGRWPAEQLHYHRFLYRAARFRELFSWFETRGTLKSPRFDPAVLEGLHMNVANRRSEVAKTAGVGNPEHLLELRLRDGPELGAHFQFDVAKTFRGNQIPVGLFTTKTPLTASAIFPGGKGAIDLAYLHDGHLWIFELKARKNISVGTLSELFFYVCMTRDLCMGKLNAAGGEPADASLRMSDIQKATRITGVMMGHELHPLIDDQALLDLLNSAAAMHWKGRPKVEFESCVIAEDLEGKLQFSRRHSGQGQMACA